MSEKDTTENQAISEEAKEKATTRMKFDGLMIVSTQSLSALSEDQLPIVLDQIIAAHVPLISRVPHCRLRVWLPHE
jgi:hypothetical protein